MTSLLMASGVLVAGAAPAMAQEAEYSALAKYYGELPFDQSINDVTVSCWTSDGTFGARCQPEGTVNVTIGAAARRRLGLTTNLLAHGTLTPYTSTSTTAKLKIAPATKRKLKRAFEKARAKCHNCETPLPVNARMTVTLTGPAGMPLEKISDTVQVGVGSIHGGNKQAWAWTSNYNGWKPGGSGADAR
jgi:hypothetical protein